MSRIKNLLIRADPVFKKELDEIKILRIKNGTSNKMISDRRLTKALRRMDTWIEIKKRLVIAKIEDDFNEID